LSADDGDDVEKSPSTEDALLPSFRREHPATVKEILFSTAPSKNTETSSASAPTDTADRSPLKLRQDGDWVAASAQTDTADRSPLKLCQDGDCVAASAPTDTAERSPLKLCQDGDWVAVLDLVKKNPAVAITPIVMDNHVATTFVHQAITSKGNTALRVQVICQILKQTPQAAAIKNGYGSL